MAVIIPMAKMPNNCEECDLKALCPDYWTKIREEYTRPSWCQLDDLDATTFCGVPMEEAVEIMQMYRRGELVNFKDYAIKTEPQRDCFLCKWLGEVDVCGRCRNRNLFCEAEPQPRCPKCGKRGYIRSLESMGVKLKVFDEYKWKCTNCNKYFKEEPKDEPQTESESER